LKIDAIRQEGYALLHNGLIELSRIERNGIRIDVPRLQRTKSDIQDKLRKVRQEIEEDRIWKLWRRRFGPKASLTARDQISAIFHTELDYAVTDETESGKPSTDEEALQKIDHPFIPKLIRFQKYDKALGTFLTGIERETVDGRLHPFFNLHTVKTYRSSSNSPNFQNFPVRDKEIAEIIRSLFIASKGHLLVENDFKGIEVGVSACYHHDRNFISYITTPGKDMHRDMAAQIYCLEPHDVSKDARYGAKNKFVFPQFYGDYYVACAKALWEWIDKGKLTAPGGMSLKGWLKSTQGIKELGACDPDEKPRKHTFEKHIQEVENDFWNVRFMEYGKWRRDWYHAYLDKGYFDLLTGFRVFGSFGRNAVTNYPVQGSAFHCLLWTLIRVNRLLRKYKMRSMIVGQIHDSLIGDVHQKELKNYLEIVEHTVTVELRKAYPWLIVPLEVEYELAPVGGNWFQKREVKFKQGRFYHPDKPDKFTTDAELFLREILGRN